RAVTVPGSGFRAAVHVRAVLCPRVRIKTKSPSRRHDIWHALIRLINRGFGGHSSQMNKGLRTTALAGLLIAAVHAQAGAQTAAPSAGLVPVHHKYAGRATPASPALRSSAALVLDTTHSSVLYSRRSDVALPIASITKLMTALVVMQAGQPLDEPIEITLDD